jgi:hypothetical protein
VLSVADTGDRDVLTFAVTISPDQARPDLGNAFAVRHIPGLLDEFGGMAHYFHFLRRAPGPGNEQGDAIWLRFKARTEHLAELREGVQRRLRSLEESGAVGRVWEPRLESDQEVFGMAPGIGPTSAYKSLWCFLDSTSRTAINILALSEGGRLDVPEWVIADIWIHFFYNALGIPDFAPCPACREESMRLPRCHACGFELEQPKADRGGKLQ